MEAKNQNNNEIGKNNMNYLMWNGMMQNPMYNLMWNGMMPNNMNNVLFNIMMQNQVNNPMMNEIMTNNMNNHIFNGMMQNQMNNPGFGITQNPKNNPLYNGIMSNPMNNSMFNGIMNNQESFNLNYNINISNNNFDSEENIPIENSIKLDLNNNEQIQYYLYPEIVFTEEEWNNSKVLLIIGQTGHGKTTFVNALVNIYSGITIKDKFRYLLVKNKNNSQLESDTKEITIYKIRPKKNLNFPPLIIIDTPGFGDTEGEEKDKQNLIKFKEFFDSKKINNINCILYIIIGANSRFGKNDKNIINYLLNLFSKNVKDNFVVGVTNFIALSKRDTPNIIKSLSDENHFYYQNVLKNNLSSRDQVINSYWYFTSENKIISNNEIEGNLNEMSIWKYTENQIKNFIENKIKVLEKKNIEDSQQVLDNRFQLENEINCFKEKIDSLISKKLVFESNIVNLENYQKLIINLEDKITKNKLEQENIVQTLKEINNTIPYMKKIINSPIQSQNKNLICEKCQSNCHKNCNCTFTNFSKWFCDMISFSGNCKICNHDLSVHKKGNIIYIQKEENEQLKNNDIEELNNYIKYLFDIKKKENLSMNSLNEENDILNKAINQNKKLIENCNKEIEIAKKINKAIENDIFTAFQKIEKNLDFLRKNALNQENRTIKIFIEEYSKSKNDKEKKIIENLY